MKREILSVVVLVAGVMALAVAGPRLVDAMRSPAARPALVARADQRVVTLDVNGMTCAGCSARITTRLAAVPGVAAVDLRFKEHRATVVCARGVADSALTGAVAAAGSQYFAAVSRR